MPGSSQRVRTSPLTAAASVPKRIAGRYVVDRELAVGGMGAVYSVRDETTGRALALKRLLPAVGAAGEALFRREYHTLVLLKHPRIIEVFEYGVDDSPYYTMELLDGEDLRALAPLEYRQACSHLRDVASSLALLASHRLVHRDLSSRNVRVTSEGRCKLIDFGALVPFGIAENLVGTVPFMPPEAVRGQPLDQRSDLFSLGVLAYYLLTGSHPFVARDPNDLENEWKRRPERPSVRGRRTARRESHPETIPRALDELVLSMLSLDPMARPQHAAEVIDRLGAIAYLPQDPGPRAAESYIQSGALVGRAAEMERARSVVSRVAEGTGGTIAIRHGAGTGGTRLLTEIGVEARLSGISVIQVDAETCRDPAGVLRALADNLNAALPEEARAAAPPETDAPRSRPAPISEKPSARPRRPDPAGNPLAGRIGLQESMERWFLGVAAYRPLALLVDGAHAMDEPSSAFLAYLAAFAREHALLIVVARRLEESMTAEAPLSRLEAVAERIDLGSLSPSDTLAFVHSVFGNVPDTDRLAHSLHLLAGGNPLHIMELCRHLVSREAVEYADGSWVLPQELPSDLPSRLEEAAEQRLARLTPAAQTLASELAVHEGQVSLDFCVALSGTAPDASFAALDELISSGILIGHRGGYLFARKSTREQLLGRLEPNERKRVHLAFGKHFAGVTAPDLITKVDAGWHLLRGGEESRGAAILRGVGLELVEDDDLPEAVPILEAAVAVYRTLERPRNELCGLIHSLAFAGYYVELRLADEYGDEAQRLLAEEIGLALVVRVRPYLGTYLSLIVGLVYAVLLHWTGGRGGLRGLNAKIAGTGGLSSALTGSAVICLNQEGALRYAAAFEPFEPLGLWHAGAFSHAFAKALAGLTEDHGAETVRKVQALLRRFQRPGGVLGFPDHMKPVMEGGLLYALGAMEGFADDPAALARAQELEACGLRLYDMVACQIRSNYHAYRGESALARRYERQVELHAIRNGSTWQAEVWAPTSQLVSSKLTYDLLGMKRAAEELERLSKGIPSLRRYADMAHATLTLMRGDPHGAIAPLERLVYQVAPRSFLGWTWTASTLAESYNETGRYDRAEALCKDVMGWLSEEDRRLVALYLGIELQCALAEAGQGRAAEGAKRLDDLIARHANNRGPVTLGSLHGARARVARVARDLDTARYHEGRMEVWFRSTENPTLIAECERRAAAERNASDSPGDAAISEGETINEGRTQTDLHSDLSELATE